MGLELNENLKKITTPIIRKIAEKCVKIENSINLTIGEPDIETPRIIVEKSAKYLLENQLKYAQLGGFLSLREEVAKFYTERYGVNCNEKEVLITVGSTEAISSTLRALLKEGDEVIIPTPAFPLYEALIELSGVKIKYIDTSKTNFKLTAEELEKNITEKTKLVVVNYPCNPTGVTLNEKEVEDICKVIEKYNLYLLADEIYSEIVFDNKKFYSFGRYENIKNKVIIVNGFSKSHSMTGWRIGYLITEENLRNEILKVSQYTNSSVPSLSQIGGYIALTEKRDVSEIKDEYEKRAKFFSEKLEELGFDIVTPKGSFYIFAGYSKLSNLNSLDFALEILDKTGVALVPGSGFGLEGYVRISCTKNIEVLDEAYRRLKKYLSVKKISYNEKFSYY